MNGSDFGMGALAKGFVVLLVLVPLLLLAMLGVTVCWLCGVEPQPWMAVAAGSLLVGAIGAAILGRILRED